MRRACAPSSIRRKPARPLRADARVRTQSLVDVGPVDLPQARQRRLSGTEAALELGDVVALPDAAAEVEAGDTQLAQPLDTPPDQARRMPLATGSRDGEQGVAGVRRVPEGGHRVEPAV